MISEINTLVYKYYKTTYINLINMGGVCNSSQTKRPVEEINISNKQC